MRRNFGLDALRCLAIVVVLANHAYLGFFVDLGGLPWVDALSFVSISAIISVEWLFVLSGFLIGTMMIRSFEAEGTWWQRARSFWLRRWFRTLPNYYLFLLVNVVIVAGGWYGPLDVGGFTWKHAAFAQNLVPAEVKPYFFNESWSLALDEWFYLALPILVGLAALVLRSRPRHAFLFATLVLIAVPTVLRILQPMPATPDDWDRVYRRVTILHLDATGWGVLAAMANRWAPAFWHWRIRGKAVAGASLMVVGVASIQELYFQGFFPDTLGWRVFTAWPRFPVAFGLTAMSLGTFLAFPWIASLRPPGATVQQASASLSNYTYSLYLSHFPLLYLMCEMLERPDGSPVPWSWLWASSAAWIALAVGLSAVVYHAFEKPVSDLRERFTRRVDASPFGPAPPP